MTRAYTHLLLSLYISLLPLLHGCIKSYALKSKPYEDGELTIPGLSKDIEVTTDIYGIRHIRTEHRRSLIFAQGFVTSYDRIFQMDYMRRLAQGRLSEIYGKKTFDLDIASRMLNLTSMAKKVEDAISSEDIYRDLLDYSAGVNTFLRLYKDKRPLHFKILDYYPEEWKPIDSILLYLLFSFGVSGNIEEELLYLKFKDILPSQDITPIFPIYPDETTPPVIYNTGKVNLSIYEGFEKLLRHDFGANQNYGGTMLAIGKNRCDCGGPFFSLNFITPPTVPPLFYKLHLTSNEINIAGASLPGIPYLLIGHNERVAFGMVPYMADRCDLFIEKVKRGEGGLYYKESDGRLVPVSIIKEKIRIKGKKEPLSINLLKTDNGIIINDYIGKEEEFFYGVNNDREGVIALSIALYEKDLSILGLKKMAIAKEVKDILDISPFFGNLSMVLGAADSSGNIGYAITGKVPLRFGWSGQFPAVGWKSEFSWTGFIPSEELPSVINPEEGYFVLSGNRIGFETLPYFISQSWASPMGLFSIENRIVKSPQLTIQDVKNLMSDSHFLPSSILFKEVIPSLSILKEERGEDFDRDSEVKMVAKIKEDSSKEEVEWEDELWSESLDEGAEWEEGDADFETDDSSAAPTSGMKIKGGREIIEKILKEWDFDVRGDMGREGLSLYNCLSNRIVFRTFFDEFSFLYKELFKKSPLNYSIVEHISIIKDYPFFDITGSSAKEDKGWIIEDALIECSEKGLSYEGVDISLIFRGLISHPLFGSHFQIKGGTITPCPSCVDLISPDESGKVQFLPSLIFFSNLSSPGLSAMTIAPGQVENPFYAHYGDALKWWMERKYTPLPFFRGDIDKLKEAKLLLKPGGGYLSR